jgi:hypothetical protein
VAQPLARGVGCLDGGPSGGVRSDRAGADDDHRVCDERLPRLVALDAAHHKARLRRGLVQEFEEVRRVLSDDLCVAAGDFVTDGDFDGCHYSLNSVAWLGISAPRAPLGRTWSGWLS